MLTTAQAQPGVSSPAGEYYLQGVMETASGFKLNEDFTFQFFFSYGALDRFGEGHWSVQKDSIVLNSRKKPAHDFAMVNAKQLNTDNITIRITDSNEMVARHMYCIIRGGGQQQESVFNTDGVISFTPQPVESIELLFEFCPEKSSVFTLQAMGLNYFEFRSEPWIMELFFENFTLQTGDDSLKGAHPLLNGESFLYRREGIY
jgi:hypothetical protein